MEIRPETALYGGPDGLDCCRDIAASAAWLAEDGMIAVEVGAGQAAAVRAMLSEGGLRQVGMERDHAGVERVVKGRL